MSLNLVGRGRFVGVGCTPTKGTLEVSTASGGLSVFLEVIHPPAGGAGGLFLDRQPGNLACGVTYMQAGLCYYEHGLDVSQDYPGNPDLVLMEAIDPVNNVQNDRLRFRWDDGRGVLGPQVGHPTNPVQLDIRGGTAAAPWTPLGLAQYTGAGVDALQLVQVNAGSQAATIGFGGSYGAPLWRLGVDGANTNSSHWSLAVVGGATLIEGTTAGALGFFGVTPVARPLLATGAGHTVDDVITVLQALGLCRQS